MAHKNKRTAGFSVPEIILAVAVMAIIASMSAPPLMEFMKRRDIQNEQNMMNDILKAMQLYLADRNDLPADTSTTWADELARYTNLSANQIANDSWGKTRMYVRYVVPETFLGTDVNIYYATLHSSGPDRKAQGGSNVAGGNVVSNMGIPVASNDFATLTNSGWWKNQSTDTARIDKFVAAQPAQDDLMVRFTDYSDKIDKYNKSLQRMKEISQALESYATSKYNDMVVYCMTTTCATAPEKFIYYPRSADTSPANPATYYGSNTATDLTTYNSGSAIYNSAASDTTRRTHMINLMRILGLPDEYCCNALETVTGTKDEKPFYYFSDPRPRVGAGCSATRPNPATSRTLPARLTTVNNSGTCG